MESNEVKTRSDFSVFIEGLLGDLQSNPSEWENRTLEDFLEALGRYAEDIDGLYHNRRIEIDLENPNWRVFADLLKGSSIYE